MTTCIEQELNVDRLANIQSKLWLAGRLEPPRSLHYQLVLGREICVTEKMDLHLVWTTGRMFLKPVPRYLLEPSFWTRYLSYEEAYHGTIIEPTKEPAEKRLRRRALGFLFSYAALISHESDLEIAKANNLIPAGVTWQHWRIFVSEITTERIYKQIDPRFYHGELRLNRLNLIYCFCGRPVGTYMRHWNQYSDFIRDNFAWVAGSIIYIALVLTAMQVGLSTPRLKDNLAFQNASYGFTVLAIMGPLLSAALIIVVLVPLVIYYWVKSEKWRKIRLIQMGVWEDRHT